MMKTVLKTAGILAVMFGMSACNTVEGFGKDTEAVGEEVQETANEVKEEITD